MASIADLRNLPPKEFADPSKWPDETLTWMLNYSKDVHDADALGKEYSRMVCLFAAHLLTDNRPGGGGGVKGRVTSERLGPAARTYATPQAAGSRSELNLEGTTYGRMYLHLQSLVPVAGLTAWDGTDV